MTHISRHIKDGGGWVVGKNIYEPYNLIYVSSGQGHKKTASTERGVWMDRTAERSGE